MGCYRDSSTARVGNRNVLTARDNSKPEFYGQHVDWFNFDIFLPKFACECAKKVIEAGYNTFGMQFYGTLITYYTRLYCLIHIFIVLPNGCVFLLLSSTVYFHFKFISSCDLWFLRSLKAEKLHACHNQTVRLASPLG